MIVTIDAGFLKILVARLKSCNHELALFIFSDFLLVFFFFFLLGCLFILLILLFIKVKSGNHALYKLHSVHQMAEQLYICLPEAPPSVTSAALLLAKSISVSFEKYLIFLFLGLSAK